MDLNIKDVRAEMPNYDKYQDWQREGDILGLAIHHSATINRATGAPVGDARLIFDYQVNTCGWRHGGYHYLITNSGQIEYALDEKVAAYHASFYDPSDSFGLEYGQYWNNHYLAICVVGWFNNHRTYRDDEGRVHVTPDDHTVPNEAQMASLMALIQHLRQEHQIPVENVRGHRELTGNQTMSPGLNVDLADLRRQLRELAEPTTEPTPAEPIEPQPAVNPGEHVLILPDTDKYLNAAMIYLWKFQPDASFAINEALGRWKYVTVVGNDDVVSLSQLARLRRAGAAIVQRIPGDPGQVQETLDKLANEDRRFLTAEEQPTTEPTDLVDDIQHYTVQPGDTLSLIAKQLYGDVALWRVIFEANRNALGSPAQVQPGQVLQIPPQ